MFHEEGHPDVPPSDWNTFRREFSPYLFEAVLDRVQIRFPEWFFPLARGFVMPSRSLLRKAGYRSRSRPVGWCQTHPDVFWQRINNLIVRTCSNQNLWTMEREGERHRHGHHNTVLAFAFGSTPVLAPNFQSAMFLAEFCLREPPSGLRWITTAPDDLENAIEFARKRRVKEATSASTPECSVAA
jgi:hypothetical protein